MVHKPHESHRMFTATDQDAVLRPDIATSTAIHHHHQAFRCGREHRDRLAITEHQSPGRQGMGGNRCELQHGAVRGNHRSTSTEGIGRRSRGRGEDHAVSSDVHRCVPTDGDLEMAHAGERFPVQGHLVERQGLPAPLITTHHAHHEVAALLNRPLLREHHLQGPVEVAEVSLGQKTEVTGVDREDRNPERGRLTGGGEHRAITTQHNRQRHAAVESLRHAGAVTEQAQVLIRIGETHHPA